MGRAGGDGGNYFTDEGQPLGSPSTQVRMIDADVSPDALDVELCGLHQNDLGNARRLISRNRGLLFSTKERGFGVFDGRRFAFEAGDAGAARLAQAVADRMESHESAAFLQTRKMEGEPRDAFERRAAGFYSFAVQSGNSNRTRAMIQQAEQMLTLPLAAFDADPDRLAVGNGTLVLHRGPQGKIGAARVEFVPNHAPADRITKLAGADYDPDAKCPAFDAFLARVQPGAAERHALARLMGYCLTGRIHEQAYFIFQGKGGDGKSTFLTAMKAALGEYAADADIESFLHRDRKGSDASPDMARLAGGVRLVKAAEPEQGARFAEAMLKKVTGGEPIVVRHLHREPFEYRPQWKLVISCNRKPQIRGDDRGIWRRTVVVPWPVSIPDVEMDRELEDKLLAERSGILNWIVSGWKDWQDGDEGAGGAWLTGLRSPRSWIAAAAEYRLNSNPFGAWFDECCALDAKAEEPSRRLIQSYRGWVAMNGFAAMSDTAFGRALTDRQIGRRISQCVIRTGVSLNPEGVSMIDTAGADEAQGGRKRWDGPPDAD